LPVDCISCAQCRPNDHGCQSGDVASSMCSGPSQMCAIYNIYISDRARQVQYTIRGCSNLTFSAEGCRQTRSLRFMNDLPAIQCLSLCDWDGCNSNFGNGPLTASLNRKRRR
ncbi:hypothetical protein Bpfe_018768, partial [Biomphalaria pfeifferi]